MQLNVMFQSRRLQCTVYNVGLVAIYREFLSCYMSEAYWKQTPLKDIHPTSQVNLLPLPKMYMGAMVTLSLAKEEYKLLRSTDIHHFLKCVQEFFIEAPSQLKHRFPIGDPIIEMLQVLDPCVSHSKFPSLVPLASSFPNLVSQSKLQIYCRTYSAYHTQMLMWREFFLLWFQNKRKK